MEWVYSGLGVIIVFLIVNVICILLTLLLMKWFSYYYVEGQFYYQNTFKSLYNGKCFLNGSFHLLEILHVYPALTLLAGDVFVKNDYYELLKEGVIIKPMFFTGNDRFNQLAKDIAAWKEYEMGVDKEVQLDESLKKLFVMNYQQKVESVFDGEY